MGERQRGKYAIWNSDSEYHFPLEIIILIPYCRKIKTGYNETGNKKNFKYSDIFKYQYTYTFVPQSKIKIQPTFS